MSRRIQNQPAWLLHHRPFRDSSRILEVISRDHGRVSLVARGSRSAKSKLKGILRPFLPLQVSWFIRSDLGTLTGAEMHGTPIALNGDALMSAYYINELLLNLLHRHDPQPEIFVLYERTVAALVGNPEVAPLLRSFELELLRLLGYAVNLDHDMQSGEPLSPDSHYTYRLGEGPVQGDKGDGALTFRGADLVAIDAENFADPEVLNCANRLLREVIAWHLQGKELKSRKVLREMRRSSVVRT